MKDLQHFIDECQKSLTENTFAKITLSKPHYKSADLKNVYVRRVSLNDEEKLYFTYRYATNDQTKNFTYEEAFSELQGLLDQSFRNATLFTLEKDLSLRISKKGKTSINTLLPTFSKLPDTSHDVEKHRKTDNPAYFNKLGITDNEGNVIPKMSDKFKQINKYLEIVENLIKQANLKKNINVVDMGSGKGYLTFALYDYLNNKLGFDANVVGIEMRKDLVDKCNAIANEIEYSNLKFKQASIQSFANKNIDILIALHACDTATDDAIYKGISANSELIICAPCCHKQLRKSTSNIKFDNPMMKYGIFKEREFEMLTDTIRALLMEKKGYKTNVFEFISNEHTRKNIMISAVKSDQKRSVKEIDQEIKRLKEQNSVPYHELERLLEAST